MAQYQQRPSDQSGGLLDLEKELCCSICTDILYQPLTLLDCLHTFCGSCLKEWFRWQQVRVDQEHAGSRRRPTRYVFTCPSCRASVRDTRPNATVTTLLDMFLQAHPQRMKSLDDREAISASFTPGEAVLPAQPGSDERDRQSHTEDESEDDEDEEADRRLLEEVRELSLREISQGFDADHERGNRQRRRHPVNLGQLAPPVSRANDTHQEGLRRHISHRLRHQSSLRSLLSGSHLDSHEMEEEIMRQINEEGLLDGIDLENIQADQEDEISERIAEAYRRRRRRHRSREMRRSELTSQEPPEQPRSLAPRHHRHRSESTSAESRRRPASRPHLLDPSTFGNEANRRSSSQGADRDSRDRNPPTAFRAPRARTDLDEHPRSESARSGSSRDVPSHPRSSTDPETQSAERGRRHMHSPTVQTNGVDRSAFRPPTSEEPIASGRAELPEEAMQPAELMSNAVVQSPTSSVSCNRCGKPHIEFDLHYTCAKCAPPNDPGGTYDLCLRCYRLGRGCFHWFGFGYSALQKWEKLAPPEGYPPEAEPPHVLHGKKYVRIPLHEAGNSRQGNTDEVQQGVFCDNCTSDAKSCYWQCDHCNGGEWGFCNQCVNAARHCSHPLRALSLQYDVARDGQEYWTLVPLMTPATCNVCSQSIGYSTYRMHCPDCENGDFDLCLSCFSSFVNRGWIQDPQNRRCPNGHPMVILYHEEWGPSPSRIVKEGPVGGWHDSLLPSIHRRGNVHAPNNVSSWIWADRALHGDLANQRRAIKASSGLNWDEEADRDLDMHQPMGSRVFARWAYVPQENDFNELEFPKHAIIEEAVDINEDWCWGVYCRKGGLFPSAYVQVVG